MAPRGRLIVAAVPPVGALLLALVARHESVYHALVREDSILEWAQVGAYAVAFVVAARSLPRLLRDRQRASAFVVATLALGVLVAIGEELSWGQRLIGFETPDLFAQNRQRETTLHNEARIEPLTRLALLLAAMYGAIAPLVVRRPTPFVPPTVAITFFATTAVYFAVRLLFLPSPTYAQAKYSEWPELCFAAGVALWCLDAARRRRGPRLRSWGEHRGG